MSALGLHIFLRISITCTAVYKSKGKGPVPAITLFTGAQKRFDNLESGSWLAWANDTAAHYAAILCPPKRAIKPAASRHTIAPISHTRLSPCNV